MPLYKRLKANLLQRGKLEDRSQRMITPHPLLKVNVAEKLAGSIVAAVHAFISESYPGQLFTVSSRRRAFFQQPDRDFR
jgi:hypothetical protein